MRCEWTELALLQLQTGNTAMLVFMLAVVLVFLVLAAQYESWSLPLAVILVVPMCLLCSIAAVLVAHLDVNIFTQVGFVVLIGLACKNAILIVEFARARRIAGQSRYDATLAACGLRLRPIVMTSFAFILGVVPLVLSEGAGAEMRRTLGHRGVRRHVGGDAVRHFSDASVLLCDRMGERFVPAFPSARIGRSEFAGRSGARSSRPAWAFGGSGIDLGRKLRINRSRLGRSCPLWPCFAHFSGPI